MLRLLGIDVLRGALDEADDVAHAENAAGDALRMEVFKAVELFAGAQELDRLAGDGAHRERRAAAAIAVDARQDDAGDADLLIEVAREIDGVLAGQRIGDEQRFIGLGDVAHRGRFGQQFLIDMKPAGGIEHDDIDSRRAALPTWRAWRSRPASRP